MQYGERLKDLQATLEKETEQRQEVEEELSKVKAELEETVKDRPAKIKHLKEVVGKAKEEKTKYQDQLTRFFPCHFCHSCQLGCMLCCLMLFYVVLHSCYLGFDKSCNVYKTFITRVNRFLSYWNKPKNC